MKKYGKYIYITLAILIFFISVCFIPINATRFIPVVEKQISQEYGVQSHIEKLIFRFGPSLKLKAPVMHVLYNDGQKFAQFNNVKFYIPWSALFKDDITVKRLYADKFISKINSDDKYLQELLNKYMQKDFNQNPNVKFKNYNLTYNDRSVKKSYRLEGTNLELNKIPAFNSIKLIAEGDFYINDKHYIGYNLTVTPKVTPDENFKLNFNINDILKQIVDFDFHSDIMADVKIYNGSNNEVLTSGLVNIDNISVFDPEKKFPKSFIYLTLLGNKIGIFSNIYTSNENKIYAEGIINNSKKPEIDIKVKTDNIELSELFKKLKLLFDISKYKNINSLTGKLSADFSLKGDLNKIKSNGYMKVQNGSLNAGGVGIERINSEIDFSNNVISITNANGYVKDSPIVIKGKIDKNIDLEFLMNKVELKHMLPSSYGVKSGIISVAANLTGTLDNIIHKENVQVNNFKILNDNNMLSFDSLKFDSNKDNAAYVSNIQIKPKKTELIKLPLLKLYIEHDKINIPETNIFLPNSKLVLKSDIANYNNNNITFSTNVDGFINSKDLSGYTNVSAIYPIKLEVNGNKQIQNIDSQIHLEKATVFDEPGIINFVSKIENDSLKIEDLSFVPFSGTLVKNIKPNLKGAKKIIISGIVENFSEPSFKNLRIFIPQILNVTVNDTIAQIKGDLFFNGKLKKTEIVGQLSVQNLINQFLQLSVNNAVIDFNKETAVINAPNVKLADSIVNVNATALTDISKELIIKNINVKSKYFNTDTFLMYKDAPLFNIVPITINDGKFYSERVSATLYNSPIYLSAINSDFKLNNKILKLKNLSSELYNGKLAGDIDFDLTDESFVAKLQARAVSASPIFNIVMTKNDSISGSMNFDTLLKGNLSTKSSLDGNVKFIIHNGHMGTLGKLEHLLYAQNVIADNMLRTSLSVVTKAIILKDTGLFKYLQSDVDLSAGIANIKLLQSQGPLMSLFVKGQYNILNDYAKLTVLGRLSDEIISGLGPFGEFSLNKLMVMLTGEETKQNTVNIEDFDKLPQLPMKNTKEFRSLINGTLEKPSSVIMFNWISYSQKSLRQKDVPQGNQSVPDFIEQLPY